MIPPFDLVVPLPPSPVDPVELYECVDCGAEYRSPTAAEACCDD